MRVKPVDGRLVRDPVTKQLLPAEGREVPDDQFWRRRLRDGDIVLDTPNPAPPRRATIEGV
jgi:Protein of unknown function (DUF2635)